MHRFIPYLPVDRLHALQAGLDLPDRTRGAALFADISGFTPLTGALAKEFGRQKGAEKVLDIINPVYDALIAEIHNYHGVVIGFAGDSITCWFDNDSGYRAVTCAIEMQQAMLQFSHITLSGGAEINLSVKIAITAGPARRFLVGNPKIHQYEVAAGLTLDRMAGAEQLALKGEIVIGSEIADQLAEDITILEWREITAAGEKVAVVSEVRHPASPSPWPALPAEHLSPDLLRPWLEPAVFERLINVVGFIAELRPVVSLFLKFSGIDYDLDDHAGEKLDQFIRWVQAAIRPYEGSMLQLTIGDKGSNLLIVFGAPIAHDDDIARAIAAGLDLREIPQELAFIQKPKTGISQGIVWAGACGSRQRCIYTVMGDEVNMAARLMAKAEPGQILVRQQIADLTQQLYQYQPLGTIVVKGRLTPLAVSAAVSRKPQAHKAENMLFSAPLVGRADILEQLRHIADQSIHKNGQVVRLVGPAGVGKSHLAAVFIHQMAQQGWSVASGTAQSISQSTPYHAWKQILNEILGVQSLPVPEQISALETRFAEVHPDWLQQLPLLRDILDLPFQDNEFTVRLEPLRRRQSLFSLVSSILQEASQARPLLVVLEDVHWLDEASEGLTLSVAQVTESLSLVLMVIHRPPEAGGACLPELFGLPAHVQIDLEVLSKAGISQLLCNRLGGNLSALGLELMVERAHGNPFFTEELCDTLTELGYLQPAAGEWDLSPAAFQALMDADCLQKVDGAWQLKAQPPLGAAQLELPETIYASILHRIDRLSEPGKLLLKVASVIGRTFQLSTLSAIHPLHPTVEKLAAEINEICQRDFLRLDQPDTDPIYIFKHNATQETAYSTLLYAQRKQLHTDTAAWYEQQAGSPALEHLTLQSTLAAHYPILAYHWHQAEVTPRERIYAGLSGKQAALQFANENAIRYFSRAVELTPVDQMPERFSLILQREAVFHVIGNRENQSEDLKELAAIADQIGDSLMKAQSYLRQAIYQGARSNFASALSNAQAALHLAVESGAVDLEIQVLHQLGRDLRKQEDHIQAQELLMRAKALAESQQDSVQLGRILYELGLVEYDLNRLQSALDYFKQANQVYQQIYFRTGEIQCLSMFASTYVKQGYYSQALEQIQRQQTLSRSAGWKWFEAYAWFSSGNIYFYLGDFKKSLSAHRQAIPIWRAVAAYEMEGASLDTIGLVYFIENQLDLAEQSAKEALQIHRRIKALSSQAYDLNHLGLISQARGLASEAIQYHNEAIQIRKSLGQAAACLDDLAGLARCAMAQGSHQQAADDAQQILSTIEADGVDGIEFSVWVYLTCYEALKEKDPAKARQALEAGYACLRKSADSIQDEALRSMFMHNIPWNHTLSTQYPGQNKLA